MSTDLDDLQTLPHPDNFAPSSSETSISTRTAESQKEISILKEKSVAPPDSPRKVSKQKQRKN